MKTFSEETKRRMSEAAKKRCNAEWRKNRSEMYATKLDLDKVKTLYDAGKTQNEIAEVLGTSQKVIWRFMKVSGLQARIAAKRDQQGDKNDSWKGGKYKTDKGYVTVRMPDHPRASKNGYVFEHIVIAEKMLGRPLNHFGDHHKDNEIVHHKNEIKHDNRPENLQVMTQSNHIKLHNELRRNRKGGGSNANGENNASA